MPRSKRNPEMARRIGARIRELRDAVGITQERLAWDCDLDRAYVGHIEAGRRLPSVPVLAEIAGRLGVDVLDVMAAIAGDDHAGLLDSVRRGDGPAARASLARLGVE